MDKFDNIKKVGIFLDKNIGRTDKIKEIDKYKNLLENYNGSDWKNYIKLDKKKYQRVKCYQGINNNFAIYIISWNNFQSSSIHSHPKNGCLLKVLEGVLIEKRYKHDRLIKNNKLEKNNVSYIHDNIATHKILNNNNFPVYSIHIYSPPI